MEYKTYIEIKEINDKLKEIYAALPGMTEIRNIDIMCIKKSRNQAHIVSIKQPTLHKIRYFV